MTRRFGSTAVIIGGKTAMEKAASRLLAALEGTGVTVTDQIWYGGQPRHSVAEKLAADPRVQAADMVFGMGGGRAIDETKEIAELAGKPLFTFPTVASNCAPVTAIGVFYKEDGSVDDYFRQGAADSLVHRHEGHLREPRRLLLGGYRRRALQAAGDRALEPRP